MAQDGVLRGLAFHDELKCCRESQGWTTARNCICHNVTGRTNERITKRNRARAGSLAIVDYPQAAPNCIIFYFVLFCFAFR